MSSQNRRHQSRVHYLHLTASALAIYTVLASAGPAVRAQETSSGGSQAATSVEQIIVTAQRRAERLQDVPITMDVIGSDELQRRGVTDVAGLQKITPGLQFPFYGTTISPALRGVTSAAVNAGVNAVIAFYLDGVYQQNQLGLQMDLPDVERIEVLKGPQGTLYGMNAIGGAIVIHTVQPSDTLEGRLALSYGNYNDFQARGYISGPLIEDRLAASLSFGFQDRDGFRRSTATGKRDSGLESAVVRGKLRFTPSDNAALTLTGHYAKRTDSSPFTTAPYQNETLASVLDPASIVYTGAGQRTADDGFLRNRLYGFSLTGEFDMGVGDLTSISSYQNAYNYLFNGDLDASPLWIAHADNQFHMDSVTQEINFVSKKFGGARISAGLFYSHTEEIISPNLFTLYAFPFVSIPAAPGPIAFQSDQYNGSARNTYAAWAEVSYDVTEKITITAGGRYTRDTQHGRFGAPGLPHGPITELTFSPATFNKFSPRVTARYAVTDNSNIYASYSEGFKSGILTIQSLSLPPVKPEVVTAYEVGFKGRVFDNLSLNISGFLYDYDDKQVARYVPPDYFVENAATARIKGIDLDVTFDMTSELTLSANIEYLDAKYRSYPEAGIYVPDPVGGGLLNAVRDLGGQRMERAPEFTGTFSIDYHVETDIGLFNAHASLYHSSTVFLETSGRIRQKPYDILDLEMGYAPDSLPGLRLSVYGSNVTNEAYLVGALETPFGSVVPFAPPRQYGARIEYRF